MFGDSVNTCAITSQVPAASLREYARLTRPGGKILFAVEREPWESYRYAAELDTLVAEGKLSVASRGAPFQMMPTAEP